MVTCRDVLNLKLDGMELIAGEAGLDKMVSWTYLVQTRPYSDHMNQGNFALIVVDYVRFDFDEVGRSMEELYELGISGLAISVAEDKEAIPKKIIQRAEELKLPLFYVRWEGAPFVDISQSIGTLILETNVQNKRTGDYLYNLLFGYEINKNYVEKISGQFGLDFTKPYRVGVIVVDRKYGINLEQDEHTYEHYADCLNREVINMKGKPMFMRFLNKFVLLFEAKKNKEIEREVEEVLRALDDNPRFGGNIKSTCILGKAYNNPRDFSKSYQEAKSLIPKKDLLPHAKNKKVISISSMGIYKYLFDGNNHEEILEYCNDKLRKLEEYDHANGTFLCETLVSFYMNGFSMVRTAEALYIHRNSLQYRLKKIEELLGIELDDSVEYLDLINCIFVKKWIFS
ncbi:MAG: PucR family transcriptional regulator ligand-binding domain-containing protein [Muribaculaceae bacterium]|nr:PucR family transcriptional regulator ligand-binding domain-containing protein [Muribaculaceae bacterium]MCM1398988.1 PucR family transcriptional regulator ligand-binding domain-containing protein [Clostridium sp.]MCM1458846.1 PucR family transcriptional regulator ligand-binding domain-containing protein [Bacteroides sp.]